ncbi:hypothetical protein GGX14DRAFT_442308 [Mycena pura]|uniref:Uncharacterized protein n=1 Tax=Mycena pura TaxID=153505 RepID=A0AAD6YFD9_9AGAR|nr:hypothetical protein GGX14DRAFT_442308 [Mycena pura]
MARTHRLRRDVAVYATGFVVTLSQMEEMARKACTPDFIKKYCGQVFLALRWHVHRHRYQILCNYGANEYLFAVDFIPALRGEQGPPDLTPEQTQAWYELLEDYEQKTMPYPSSCPADFLQDVLQEVIMKRKLGHFLEPAPPTLAELIDIARERARQERQHRQPDPCALHSIPLFFNLTPRRFSGRTRA